MEIRYVQDSGGIEEVRSALDTARRIALDCEAAGFHRYSDRLCLIQLTSGERTFLLDPFEIDVEPLLRPTLEDREVEVVMHGADYDVRLLDRDLGVRLSGLFDTQIAASLLGAEGIGLSSVLEDRLGVRISKKYQKADWARRPLPDAMIEYAALDTAHLPALADALRDDLTRTGRFSWAVEEFQELERVRFEATSDQDPVMRVREARDLEPREVARLREALLWRDDIARQLDRALFRVAGDSVLVEAARRNPRNVAELQRLPGLNGSLAGEWGAQLVERFRSVNARPEADVEGYPFHLARSNGGGRGRPTPEVEERLARLKAVRNERAADLGVDRGTLLPNSVLHLVAESPPGAPEEMATVPGMRRWQAELLAHDLMAAL